MRQGAGGILCEERAWGGRVDCAQRRGGGGLAEDLGAHCASAAWVTDAVGKSENVLSALRWRRLGIGR